jgi:hypothetical protein
MSGEESSEAQRRVKPDGSAWKEAQKSVADRNDAARKRGIKERADRERDAAVRSLKRQRDENISM